MIWWIYFFKIFAIISLLWRILIFTMISLLWGIFLNIFDLIHRIVWFIIFSLILINSIFLSFLRRITTWLCYCILCNRSIIIFCMDNLFRRNLLIIIIDYIIILVRLSYIFIVSKRWFIFGSYFFFYIICFQIFIIYIFFEYVLIL